MKILSRIGKGMLALVAGMMLMQAATPCSTRALAISSAVAWLGQVQSVIRVDVGIAQRYRIILEKSVGHMPN